MLYNKNSSLAGSDIDTDPARLLKKKNFFADRIARHVYSKNIFDPIHCLIGSIIFLSGSIYTHEFF